MDDQKKNPETKNNNPTVWFALVILAFLAVSLVLILNQSGKTLDYADFVRLLKVTQYDDSQEKVVAGTESTSIIVVKEPGTDGRITEFRSPNNLEIGDKIIRGRLEYRIVKGKSGEESADFKKADFTCNKDDADSTNESLQEMLIASNARWSFEAGPSAWDRYGIFLITMGLIIGLFWLMMRRLGGAGGPMQFGRSRGRLMADEDLGVMFSDVAGIDEAVEEVKEVVDFLQKPEKYQKLGGKIPRGVLLVGPPGTGKTLLAKAIAGEAGVPFFSLSGSDFVEMFVGVGAARVRDMFQQAEAKAPCIIFIDELDALGKTRGGSAVGGHDEREQTLNALLVEMDGFASNSGVIVMAATNRPVGCDA